MSLQCTLPTLPSHVMETEVLVPKPMLRSAKASAIHLHMLRNFSYSNHVFSYDNASYQWLLFFFCNELCEVSQDVP